MRIYLAGAWGHRAAIEAKAAQLELGGHEITYAWFTKSAGLDRRADALLDLHGVLACDVFVAVADDPLYVYRGTATELGIALGARKPVYVVLPPPDVESDVRKNVFVEAPGVTQLPSWQDVLRVLGVVTRDHQAVLPPPKRQRLRAPQTADETERIVTAVLVYAQKAAGFAHFPDGVLELARGGGMYADAMQRAELAVYEQLRAFLRTWARSAALTYAGLHGAAAAPCECVHCAGTEARTAHALAYAAAERELNDPPPAPPRGDAAGVAGCMGAGKTTLVARLLERHGGAELAFAAPLYDVLHYAQDLLGLPHIKDRALLQYLGTEWGRALEPRVWEQLCLERVERALAAGLNAYVSDMRFPNEYEALRSIGARTLRVVRPYTAAEAAARAGTGTTTHASESALDGVQMEELRNDGTLAEFLAKIDALELAHHPGMVLQQQEDTCSMVMPCSPPVSARYNATQPDALADRMRAAIGVSAVVPAAPVP